MFPTPTRTAVLACFASFAMGKVLVLNFDDILIPNEDSCGIKLMNSAPFGSPENVYHGVAVSASNQVLPVFNTTETAACSGGIPYDNGLSNVTVSPFGLASSLPNLAMAPFGLAELQMIDEGRSFFGDITLTIGFQLQPDDITANSTITVTFELTDFGVIDKHVELKFFAANGPGPFKITIPNNDSFVLFIPTTYNNFPIQGGTRLTPLFLDDVTFNVTD